MSSEEVYLEPALGLRGDALTQRLESILEESWTEFEAEHGSALAARPHDGDARYPPQQQQRQHVRHHRQAAPLP
mgnify:CR=1 FL=1